MFLRKSTRLLLVWSLMLLLCSLSPGKTRKLQRIAPGSWGGEHIHLAVSAEDATVEYDCAGGTIKGPLNVDGKGRFVWHGTHSMEHGGPIRSGEPSSRHPAIYTGWIKGNTMTLTAKLSDTNDAVGTFSLVRGSEGRVMKCR